MATPRFTLPQPSNYGGFYRSLNPQSQGDDGADEGAFNSAYWQVAPERQAYEQTVANQRAIYGNASGLNQQIQNDPLDAMIRSELQRNLDTKGLEQALFAQGTDMGAAANAQRSGQIVNDAARRGGNIDDPSVQAALRQSQTQQQQNAQTARRDATLAGYQQRGQAVGQAGNYGAQRANTLMAANQQLTGALSMPSIVAPRAQVNTAGQNMGATNAGMQAAVTNARTNTPGYGAPQNTAASFADWQRQQQFNKR